MLKFRPQKPASAWLRSVMVPVGAGYTSTSIPTTLCHMFFSLYIHIYIHVYYVYDMYIDLYVHVYRMRWSGLSKSMAWHGYHGMILAKLFKRLVQFLLDFPEDCYKMIIERIRISIASHWKPIVYFIDSVLYTFTHIYTHSYKHLYIIYIYMLVVVICTS